MAQKPAGFRNTLQILLGNFQILPKGSKGTTQNKNLYRPQKSTITQQERNDIVRPLLDEHSSATQKTKDPANIMSYAKDISEGISKRRIENERIMQMAPEIGQAASIVIPSILSPNDLRNENVQIACTNKKINSSEQTKISEYLTGYFNEKFRINTRLYNWIFETTYGSGSMPLLLIPVSELDNQFNNPDHFGNISMENLNTKLDALEDVSVFGLSSAANATDTGLDSVHDVVVEGLEETYPGLYDGSTAASARRASFNDTKKDALQRISADFTSEESLKIIDNPDVVKKDAVKKQRMDKNTKKHAQRHYKEAKFISLTDSDALNSEHLGHPFFMELSPDSVIPIFTPKTPSDHLGYFILLDENGCPVKDTSEPDAGSNKDKLKAYTKENKNDFDTLFKAYGIGDFIKGDKPAENVISDMYQKIIENHLQTTLERGGFSSVSIGRDNSVYKAMFMRYLRKRKTKLLFVPKDMLVYTYYKCGNDGTGRSILEECKFILSLRITLTISRMMATVNNAVDRRQIEVNFDSNFKGNVIEYLEQIQKAYLEKNSLNFSYDPQDISSQIVEKGISIKANNIPGMDQFSINHTDNNRNAPAPDEQLSEDIRNLLILSLRVPPSALNSLSENEYSRSIATTNLFFSRYIKSLQNHITRQFSEFIRTYVRYSKTLQKDIMDIVAASNSEKEGKDAITGSSKNDFGMVFDSENEEKREKNDYLLERIIDSIEISLPPPNVAPDKAQFETLDSFVGSVSTLVEQIYSDEMIGTDSELSEALAEYRALIKSKIFKDYSNTIGLGKNMHIPDIKDVEIKTDGQEMHQTLANFKQSIEDMKKAFNNKNT